MKWRDLWRTDKALLVQVYDSIAIGIFGAAEKWSEPPCPQQHGCVTFRTGHVGLLLNGGVAFPVDRGRIFAIRVLGAT